MNTDIKGTSVFWEAYSASRPAGNCGKSEPLLASAFSPLNEQIIGNYEQDFFIMCWTLPGAASLRVTCAAWVEDSGNVVQPSLPPVQLEGFCWGEKGRCSALTTPWITCCPRMNTLGSLLCVHQAGNFAVCLEDFKYTEGKPRCVSYCRFNFFSGDSLRYSWLSAIFEIHRDKIPALFAHCFLCRSKNSWNWKCYKTFFYQIFYRLLPIKWIFYIFQCFTATYLKQSLETQTWWRTSLNHTLEFISSDCWAARRRRGVVFTLKRKKKLMSKKLPNTLSHGKEWRVQEF